MATLARIRCKWFPHHWRNECELYRKRVTNGGGFDWNNQSPLSLSISVEGSWIFILIVVRLTWKWRKQRRFITSETSETVTDADYAPVFHDWISIHRRLTGWISAAKSLRGAASNPGHASGGRGGRRGRSGRSGRCGRRGRKCQYGNMMLPPSFRENRHVDCEWFNFGWSAGDVGRWTDHQRRMITRSGPIIPRLDFPPPVANE